METKKVALLILDGWGKGDGSRSDAVYRASTPYMDFLEATCPYATLTTHGEHVGLPEGQMGNSEVGHLTIGSGRVVDQELTRINKAIQTGAFSSNATLKTAFSAAKRRGRTVHLMGLVSTGGVHSSRDHLLALCRMADQYGIERCFIHAFTDGRDCHPKSGLEQLAELERHIAHSPIAIASLIGRCYAMDRDERWERIQQAYQLLVNGCGTPFEQPVEALRNAYATGVTDEFVPPHIRVKDGVPVATIQRGDTVICFNFRTDRCREITRVLTQQHFPDFDMAPLDLDYLTMTNYDETFNGIQVIFEKENIRHTLGEVIALRQLNQLRIAETEKYPHVSFFFSGGREQPFEGEQRLMIPSPKVKTYDEKPEMSAAQIALRANDYATKKAPDFICLNFANADMVGHTGHYPAILKAVQTVDNCVKQVVTHGQKEGYSFVVIADHGNADCALNSDGSPHTAHSLNPVPIIVIDERVRQLREGTLRDVAPTVLALMGLPQPEEMTGIPLVSK